MFTVSGREKSRQFARSSASPGSVARSAIVHHDFFTGEADPKSNGYIKRIQFEISLVRSTIFNATAANVWHNSVNNTLTENVTRSLKFALFLDDAPPPSWIMNNTPEVYGPPNQVFTEDFWSATPGKDSTKPLFAQGFLWEIDDLLGCNSSLTSPGTFSQGSFSSRSHYYMDVIFPVGVRFPDNRHLILSVITNNVGYAGFVKVDLQDYP